MFALVDGNNFYASCERVFDPSIRGKPVVVLSNNDGCAIARSQEAKAIGIRMGHPIHLVTGEMRRQLAVRSANFGLYGDMSARVVSILRDTGCPVEVYSIDESFVDVSKIRDRETWGLELRDRIRRWTGIPNCIGIGPTKTLAKLANKLAKGGAGVIDLTDQTVRDEALETFPVGDLWGVGRRWAARLQERGIETATGLRGAPTDYLLANFGVCIARTQRELQGRTCIELEEVEPDRQQIMVSRSFGDRVEDHAAVNQAMATFAVRACEKLRARGLIAAGVWIFAHTDPFRLDLKQHHPSRSLTLSVATSDTRIILSAISQLQIGMLRRGHGYKKTGVALLDLGRPEECQADLFQPVAVGNDRLMSTLDTINKRFGRGTAGLGASGWDHKPKWGMRQLQLSPNYTGNLNSLPRVSC
ncbi:MAG: Y-family DNA polymerase [Luteimonas sp.]